MASSAARACPHCGSENASTFPDGSGLCRNCGRAFRGDAALVPIAAQEPGVRGSSRPRERIGVGLLGVLGGVLGFLAIPFVFALGAALEGVPISTHVSEVFNRPVGAAACAGVALLVVFAWYTTWAGFHVWRGFPERKIHLLLGGGLIVLAGALAGQGLPGVVAIVGGGLAALSGALVYLGTRVEPKAPAPEGG